MERLQDTLIQMSDNKVQRNISLHKHHAYMYMQLMLHGHLRYKNPKLDNYFWKKKINDF